MQPPSTKDRSSTKLIVWRASADFPMPANPVMRTNIFGVLCEELVNQLLLKVLVPDEARYVRRLAPQQGLFFLVGGLSKLEVAVVVALFLFFVLLAHELAEIGRLLRA